MCLPHIYAIICNAEKIVFLFFFYKNFIYFVNIKNNCNNLILKWINEILCVCVQSEQRHCEHCGIAIKFSSNLKPVKWRTTLWALSLTFSILQQTPFKIFENKIYYKIKKNIINFENIPVLLKSAQ